LRALVLSGGIALGAFEGGVYAALRTAGEPEPDWLAGSSSGAINAALIAGNPPERRVERLQQFWQGIADEPLPAFSLLFGPMLEGPLRRAGNRASVLQSLLLGRPGLFTPRLSAEALMGAAPALYDLSPLRRRLRELVDFDRLNAGAPRLSLVATDVESGERVVFDTGRGMRIGPEHVLASCALLPLFAPVEIEGRLLGDGGLAANAPLDLILDAPDDRAVLCVVVELFAAAGRSPRSLSASLARAGDMAFSNQTQRMLEGRGQSLQLRAALRQLATRLPEDQRGDAEVAAMLAQARGPEQATVVRVGYRAPPDDAGPGKLFDFSRASIGERWAAGERGMAEALRQLEAAPPRSGPGLVLHEVEA
jgi:NTE family protein